MCENKSAFQNSVSWTSGDGSLCLCQLTQCMKNTHNTEPVFSLDPWTSGNKPIFRIQKEINMFSLEKKTNYCLDLRLPPLWTLLQGRCRSLLLRWPNAFGLLQLSQGLIPLCELLGQQEHLEEQKSGVSGWSFESATCAIKIKSDVKRCFLYAKRVQIKHVMTRMAFHQWQVPFCCTPQKASWLPGTGLPFGPM